MRIVLVTGIYPPDVGGPATHAVDLRDELLRRAHSVRILTLWDGRAMDPGPDIVRFPRAWPWPARIAAVVAWLRSNRDTFEVIYATGLQPAAVMGGRLARRPVVVKIVGDLAWERGRRLGLTRLDFDPFQQRRDRAGIRIRAMRWLQNWTLRNAREIIAPSAYLRTTIERWLSGPVRVTVVPNGVRLPADLSATGTPPPPPDRFVYVGRLVEHKRVERILEATARVDGARLDVLGDGPDADRLHEIARRLGVEGRVTFRGSVARDEVLRSMTQASALVLASDYEGSPHVVVEALACGTPVISPDVGGVTEVVKDGHSGLILADASVSSLSAAMAAVLDNRELSSRLRSGAVESGAEWRIDRTAEHVEEVLDYAAGVRPGVVFLGKSRIAPTNEQLERRVSVLVRYLQPFLVGVGRPGLGWLGSARCLVLPAMRPKVLESCIFYSVGPLVAVASAVGRRPGAIVCQSPLEGAGVVVLTRLVPEALRPRVVVEVHGDWRASSREYGSGRRAAVAPLADRLASFALRRADRVRAIGAHTEALVRSEGWGGLVDRFPTYSEYDVFLRQEPVEPPTHPSALFVGSLEPVKGVDVLLRSWDLISERLPDARLTIVGDGAQASAVRRWAEGRSTHIQLFHRVPQARLRMMMDEAMVVVAPSRSEGLGRIVLEAFARARPVVGSRVGGIAELVADGKTGVLVPPEDHRALAYAVVRVLGDRALAAEMGRRARTVVESLQPGADFEAGIARLAEWAGS